VRAWQVLDHGEPATALRLRDDVPQPRPGPGELLVRVHSTSCNFADVLLCRGAYQARPAFPFSPGLECCGTVEDVGDPRDADLIGARVVGQPQLPHGGFAEYALMPRDAATLVPDEVDSAVASTLHLTYLTGWLGLHRCGRLTPDDVVVVTAAAGGVGSAAAQLAMAHGATVIGITSTPEKAELLRELGMSLVVDRSKDDVIEQVRHLSPNGGADVIFETVGGSAYDEATKFVNFEGRIVVVGFAGGTIPQPSLSNAFVKNYTIAGLHWSLYLRHRPDVVREGQREIFDLYRQGRIRVPSPNQVDLSALPDELTKLAAGETAAKIVVTLAH
jgi:NADPH2:quinone reductase